MLENRYFLSHFCLFTHGIVDEHDFLVIALVREFLTFHNFCFLLTFAILSYLFFLKPFNCCVELLWFLQIASKIHSTVVYRFIAVPVALLYLED